MSVDKKVRKTDGISRELLVAQLKFSFAQEKERKT